MHFPDKKCDKCLTKRKNLKHFEGHWFCYKCYPSFRIPLSLADHISKHRNFQLALTEKQNNALNKRLEQLSDETLSDLTPSKYVRLLVFSDLKKEGLLE